MKLDKGKFSSNNIYLDVANIDEFKLGMDWIRKNKYNRIRIYVYANC